MFEEYSKVEVVTQTWVIYSNLLIDNSKLFDLIECYPLQYPLLKFQKRMIMNEKEEVENGSIVFAEYLGNYKGRPFRKQKDKQMRNCATIIMKIDSGDGRVVKFYNIKISRKGNFQVTGCTSDKPVKLIVKYIWQLINRGEGIWSYQPDFKLDHFVCYMCCRMHNTRFGIPCRIDLRNLNQTVKIRVGSEVQDGVVEYSSTYEPSIGYGGVNVKISSSKQKMADSRVIKAEQVPGEELIFCDTTFQEYVNYLSEKERAKKLDKKSTNSFLVFQSGCIIMSGTFSEVNRKDAYEKFRGIFERYHEHFCIAAAAQLTEPAQVVNV